MCPFCSLAGILGLALPLLATSSVSDKGQLTGSLGCRSVAALFSGF